MAAKSEIHLSINTRTCTVDFEKYDKNPSASEKFPLFDTCT